MSTILLTYDYSSNICIIDIYYFIVHYEYYQQRLPCKRRALIPSFARGNLTLL